MRIKQITCLLIVFFLVSAPGFAGETEMLYSKAVKAAKLGQLDFAFMHYRSLLSKNPSSAVKEKAHFANAEYYYVHLDYPNAQEHFESFINNTKDKTAKFFALAYLLKLAEYEENSSLRQDTIKRILNYRQQTFIFRNSKEYKYTSPLQRHHKAVCTIDYIEFYVEGEFLAKVNY